LVKRYSQQVAEQYYLTMPTMQTIENTSCFRWLWSQASFTRIGQCKNSVAVNQSMFLSTAPSWWWV